jgi:hypothetical protein
MLDLPFDYASCVRSSEKIQWRLDEVLPEGTPLDFSRPFLPESLAPTRALTFLEPEERRKLNQIASNAYLNLFQFVEEYILATMTQHAQAEMFGDTHAMRALVRFVDEELKHQQLFERYRRSFDSGFGHACPVLETASEVASVIMSHTPIAVMIVTLHIELMTQQHYVESVKDDDGIDPLFKSLLRHHWLEEAQHARIDALELDKLASAATAEAVRKGIDEYFGMLDAIDGLLRQQADMDVGALSVVIGRPIEGKQAEEVHAAQLSGYRRTFIQTGLTNPTFAKTMLKLDPELQPRIDARAALAA